MREFLTDAEVSSALSRRPSVLALVDGRIYKREGSTWRLLDDKSYRSLEGMVSSGPSQD